jgi:hypothetical protein
MAMMNLVLNGSAEDFLTSIAKNIKAEVDSFFGELHKEGKYEVFKTLPPFAQRVTFFQEVGYGSRPYQKYRDAIKSWILYGNWHEISDKEWWHSLCTIKEDAGSRADEIKKLESKYESSYWRYHDTFGLDEMEKMRKGLIEGNPILRDNNIPLGLRKELFDAALKGSEEYKKNQKYFDSFVKKVVSSMISNYLLVDGEVDAYYRQYTRITEKA